jgi:hypothetical protein
MGLSADTRGGLNPYNIWFALFAILGVVVMAPALYNWVLPQFYQYPEHVVFLATSVPVLLVIFIGAGWLQPG